MSIQRNLPRAVALAALTLAAATVAKAAPIQDPVSGRYYDVITERLNWTTARAAAETQVFNGVNGHLATVTSQQEHDFLAASLSNAGNNNLLDYWLGGYQPASDIDPDASLGLGLGHRRSLELHQLARRGAERR